MDPDKKEKIDLLSAKDQLVFKVIQGKNYVFDPVRKKYVRSTPEELVRQLLLLFLIREKGFPASRIKMEQKLPLGEHYRRPDIVVYDKNMQAVFVGECKAPSYKLDQKAFDQIAHYNLALQVKCILVSNGIHNYCCKVDYVKKNYQLLERMPSFSDLEKW